MKKLRIAAQVRKITKLLRTANATQFTSVATMLDSVLGLEEALKAVIKCAPIYLHSKVYQGSREGVNWQEGAQRSQLKDFLGQAGAIVQTSRPHHSCHSSSPGSRCYTCKRVQVFTSHLQALSVKLVLCHTAHPL